MLRFVTRRKSSPWLEGRPPARQLTIVASSLLLLVLLVALTLLALGDRAEGARAADQRHTMLARLFSEGLNRGLVSVTESVGAPARLLQAGAAEDDPTLLALMDQALVHQPWLRALGVVDAQGLVLASTAGGDRGMRISLSALGRLPAVDQHLLGDLVAARHLQDLGVDGPAIAAPAGVGFLPLLRAVQHPTRGVLYVVANLHVDWFINSWHVTASDADLALSIARYDGSLLAATKNVQRAPRADLAALPPFRDFLPRRESGTWRGAGLRSGTQLGAFHVAASQPVVVLVEVDESVLNAAWWRRVQGQAFMAAVAAALVAAMTILALRSLSAQEADKAKLHQLQVDLSRRERDLDTTVSSVQELLFRTDAAGRLLLLNPHWTALTGVEVSQALGESLTRWVIDEDRDRVQALFAPGSAAGHRHDVIRMHGPRAGQTRSVHMKILPLRDHGQLLGYAGSAVDMSIQDSQQRALQTQLAFVREMIDFSPMPMSAVDLQGRYRAVNRAWETFTGVTRDQAIGARVGEHLSADERQHHEAADERLRASGQAQVYEAQVSGRDGQRREVIVHKMLLPDEQGQTTGILAVINDVTEFRLAERAIREARDAAEEAARSQTEFIANISHELRTPLQSILGFSELGAHRAGQREMALHACFTDIHDAGDRMLKLVNDLLDVARIESPVGTLHLATTDLRSLVRSLLRELDPLLTSRRQTVDLQVPDAPLLAKVDALRLMQVLRNVVSNAIKFSPVGSAVRLVARTNDAGEPHLAIADQGPGIPDAELESIFDPFVQSSRTRDGSGGTGLGLAITRRIVVAHGGRIVARNRPGGGAVFHIVLPARGSAETQPMPL